MPDVPCSPITLLVVDDDSGGRGLLARALRAEGYRVAEAAGGHEALALLDTTDMQLVLLDIEMPDLSGLDVLRAIGAATRPTGCRSSW